MGLEKIVLFAALLAVGYAEVVEIRPCDDSNDNICKVGQVSVDPCPGGKTCVFKRGSDASLSFDFTPNFATSNLKTMVYWNNGALLPFVGFGSDDACTYTSCPTVASQSQTLNYNLHVGRKLPAGKYPLIWKVWNPDNVEQQCCFQFTIRLLQKKV